MKKIKIVLLLVTCIILLLCGCGKLSNEKITINKYKNFEITKDEETSNSELEKKIWEMVVQHSEVEQYPQDLVDEYIEELKSQYSSYAKMYGITPEEAVQKEYGVSIEQVAQNMICKKLAVELIAEKKRFKVSEKDYEEGLKELAAEYDYDDPQAFEKIVGKEKIEEEILQNKVTEFLLKHSKYK